MIQRMIDIALLRVPAYEDVENDSNATGQAMVVVVLVSIASGIGALGQGGWVGLILGIIFALIGWAVWAYATYLIGTRLLPMPQTHADWGQMARVLGFAQAPGLLRVLGFIPIIGGLIAVIATIWQIVTMVIAVRQGLDYDSTLRAVGVVLLAFLAYLVVFAIFAVILAILQ